MILGTNISEVRRVAYTGSSQWLPWIYSSYRTKFDRTSVPPWARRPLSGPKIDGIKDWRPPPLPRETLTPQLIEIISPIDPDFRGLTNGSLESPLKANNEPLYDYIIQWVPHMKPTRTYSKELQTIHQTLLNLPLGGYELTKGYGVVPILIAFKQVHFPLDIETYWKLFSTISLDNLDQTNILFILEIYLELQKKQLNNTSEYARASKQIFYKILKHVADEKIWLSEEHLVKLVDIHSKFRFFTPVIFKMIGDRIQIGFELFDQDQIGNICRSLLNYISVEEQSNLTNNTKNNLPMTGHHNETLNNKQNFDLNSNEKIFHTYDLIETISNNQFIEPHKKGESEFVEFPVSNNEDPLRSFKIKNTRSSAINFASQNNLNNENNTSQISNITQDNLIKVYGPKFLPYKRLTDIWDIHSSNLIKALGYHLPYTIHEYKYWNLIDIANFYLKYKIGDEELITRFGSEAWKLVLDMKYGYPAKALKVLAFLETSDSRTFRSLIRNVPKTLAFTWPAELIAETIIACSIVNHRGQRIYQRLSQYLQQNRISDIRNPRLICDMITSLSNANILERTLMHQIIEYLKSNPDFFHMEHIISMIYAFIALEFKPIELKEEITNPIRLAQLSECTPSSLCLFPNVLYNFSNMNIFNTLEIISQLGIILTGHTAHNISSCKDYQDRKKLSYEFNSNPNDLSKNQLNNKEINQETEENTTSLNTSTSMSQMNLEELIILLRGYDQLLIYDPNVLSKAIDQLFLLEDEIKSSHLPAILHCFSNLNHREPIVNQLIQKLLKKYSVHLNEDELISCIWSTYCLGLSNTPIFNSLLSSFVSIGTSLAPSSIHLMQIILYSLLSDHSSKATKRLGEPIFLFRNFMNQFYPWKPTLKDERNLNDIPLKFSNYLSERQISHSVNHFEKPFIIDITIPKISLNDNISLQNELSRFNTTFDFNKEMELSTLSSSHNFNNNFSDSIIAKIPATEIKKETNFKGTALFFISEPIFVYRTNPTIGNYFSSYPRIRHTLLEKTGWEVHYVKKC